MSQIPRRLSALLVTLAAAGVLATPQAMAAPTVKAGLSCKTSVGNTGGWAECSGRGTWRVVSICNNQGDKYTSWATTNSSTPVRRYAIDCLWDIDNVLVEQR